MVEAAEKYWNSVETSKLLFVKGGLKNVDAYNFEQNISGAVSGEVLVGCADSQIFSKNLWDAYGGLRFSDDFIITQAYISLDGTVENELVTYSKNALLRLLAHELGHTFGLAHSEDKNSLMFPTIISKMDSLDQDSREAVSWLYPK
jgi:predicted Zn-dependent protease